MVVDEREVVRRDVEIGVGKGDEGRVDDLRLVAVHGAVGDDGRARVVADCKDEGPGGGERVEGVMGGKSGGREVGAGGRKGEMV